MTKTLDTVESLKEKGFCLYIIPYKEGWYCGDLNEDRQAKSLRGCRDTKIEMAIGRMINRCFNDIVK